METTQRRGIDKYLYKLLFSSLSAIYFYRHFGEHQVNNLMSKDNPAGSIQTYDTLS